jgi:hypothetical protein
MFVFVTHASVQLGGRSMESWKGKINDLLGRLPNGSVWAFADHVMAQQHTDGRGFRHLVRAVGPTLKAILKKDFAADDEELGWMYTYEIRTSGE